jgi:hypothetical protein
MMKNIAIASTKIISSLEKKIVAEEKRRHVCVNDLY